MEHCSLQETGSTVQERGSVDDEPVTPIIKRVVVKPHEKRCVRKNIYDVMNPVQHKGEEIKYKRDLYTRDLFLQAFERFMQKDHKDMHSYFQIAGIHGIPYDPYDGVDPNPAAHKFWGYCAHGSTLFPTWHRIYLLLFEQELIKCALEFLEDPDNARHLKIAMHEAKDIAKEIRLPYWDWADYKTQAYGVPKYFTDAKVEVKFPTERKFANPLNCYIVPVDMVPDNKKIISAPHCTPIAKPKYAPDEVEGSPMTPALYPTVRYPTPSYESNMDALQYNVMQQCNLAFRPGVCNMFLMDSWIKMASHYGDSEDPASKKGDVYSSLEAVHDSVHDAIGGQAGHMSNVPVASFDPIFYFHHCNVDRLLALWQVMHPKLWVSPSVELDGNFVIQQNQIEDHTTPLYPFRKTSEPETFWTSDDVRKIEDLGYTYPEIKAWNENKCEKDKSPEHFTKKMLKFYIPMWWTKKQVLVTIWNIPKHHFAGSYKLLVFVGCTEEDVLTGKITTQDPNYAGFVAIFSRGKFGMKQCGKCVKSESSGRRMIFTHDITGAMRALGFRINNIPRESDKDNPYLFHVAFVAETCPGQLRPLEKIHHCVFTKAPGFPNLS